MFTKLRFYIKLKIGDLMDCIFCKIINKEISSYTIYEDELVIAFLDASPDSTGHTLIVPKQHITDIYEIDDNLNNHILKVIKDLSILLENKLNTDGFTIINNYGLPQVVKHYHVHIKPAYKVDPNLTKEEVYSKLKES